MTFKSILVPIDATAACERRVGIAVDIARRFEAGLTGIYFTPSPPPEVDRAQLPPPEVAVRMSQRETRDRVEAAFRAAAAAAQLRQVDMRVVEAMSIELAIAEMRCADLSVLSQGDPDTGVSGFVRQLAEQAVLAIGGPIVFVPYAPATDVLRGHVAVAWDGGREAARAVRDALPLLRQATRVTVLSFGARTRFGEDPQRSQARLAAFLKVHGIEADLRELACTPAEAGELLLSQLADRAADLLVMGAYGHARVREVMLGGVTRTILQSMTVPVLMSH